MGPIGGPEMIFIFFLALLLFGPKKLPELGRTVGKAMAEFQRAKSSMQAAFERETRQLALETDSLAEMANRYRQEVAALDAVNAFQPAAEAHAVLPPAETAPATAAVPVS
jgi:sec-independent protein translocase protein TatA